MKFKIRNLLLLITLITISISQFYFLNPMFPKTEPLQKPTLITQFEKSKPKVEVIKLADAISEEDLKIKYGKIEEIILIDGTKMTGVVIQQTEKYIKVETIKKTFTIPIENLDSIEILK